MSQVPAKIRTTPAQRSWPRAASDAATKVKMRPTTVTWFGVKGTRPMADIRASALRRTQASNRVVNMAYLSFRGWLLCRLTCLLVHLDHLRGDRLPRVAAGFFMTVRPHAPAKICVAGE